MTTAALDVDYELEEELTRKRRDGSLIRDKAKMVVEAMLDVLARKGLNPETSDAVRFQILDRMVDLGDLKPKPNAMPTGQGGAAFAVQIILPPGAAAPGHPNVLTAQAHQVATPQAPIIEIPFASDELPPAPAHVRARFNPETSNAELHAAAEA
jgi:hypothetical protein